MINFLREQFLERFHGGVGARDANVVIYRGGADMNELGGVVAQAPGIAAERHVEQRVEHGAVLQRADDSAVLGRHIIDLRSGRVARRARHVGHHHARIARNVFRHVASEEPRIDVIAAAGGRADDQRDLLAAIELGDRVLGERAAGRKGGDRKGRHQQQPAPHPPACHQGRLACAFNAADRRRCAAS